MIKCLNKSHEVTFAGKSGAWLRILFIYAFTWVGMGGHSGLVEVCSGSGPSHAGYDR
jgi:hypothetical protein